MQDATTVVRRFMDGVLGVGKTPTLDQVREVEGLESFLRPFQDTFPDLSFVTESVTACGHTVIVEAVGKATHLGAFNGIPPLGAAITFRATITFRVENGNIVQAIVEPEGGDIWHQLHNVAESGHPWYRRYAGGMWEKEGRRQLQFLMGHGLQAHHYLLDIGCGTLKGGVKLIPYLDRGHYYGVDASSEALSGAREASKEANLDARQPHLIQMDDFNFIALGQQFEYALAKSLFTEIPLNSIIRCIMSVEKVLCPQGRFYATFWENKEGKFNLDPLDHMGNMTYFDRYPYHYDFATFEWICDSTTLQPRYLGPWAEGVPQRLIEFVKS